MLPDPHTGTYAEGRNLEDSRCFSKYYVQSQADNYFIQIRDDLLRSHPNNVKLKTIAEQRNE